MVGVGGWREGGGRCVWGGARWGSKDSSPRQHRVDPVVHAERNLTGLDPLTQADGEDGLHRAGVPSQESVGNRSLDQQLRIKLMLPRAVAGLRQGRNRGGVGPLSRG